MKKYLFGFIGIFAAVAAFASVPPGTCGGDDVNPRTRLVTNAWENAKGDIMAVMTDGEARPLPRYIHALTFFDAYPAEAAAYYATLAEVGGGCSAVRDGNTFARNFDFPFDDRAEFVITMQPGAGRFASVGVANVGTNLTEAMVNSGKPEHSAKYKWLPGATTDGVNENGVAACINVVSSFGHTNGWHGATVHYLAAVRRVLDTATNAADAAADLAANVYVPQSALDRGYSFHYIVADRTATYIVEDGEARTYTGRVVMTNYRLFDPGEPYGTGRERAALLANPDADITEAWFTLAYEADTRPIRYSEFVAPGKNPTNEYDNAVASWANGLRETHRGKGFWQSVHTSIYDIENLTLKIAVQEIPDFYTFAIPQGGKVKSVNGYTGDVTLDSDDVGALPNTYTAPVQSVNGKTGAVTLGAADVHALPDTYTPPPAPVQSVNGKTGAVNLSAGDVGAATVSQLNSKREKTDNICYEGTKLWDFTEQNAVMPGNYYVGLTNLNSFAWLIYLCDGETSVQRALCMSVGSPFNSRTAAETYLEGGVITWSVSTRPGISGTKTKHELGQFAVSNESFVTYSFVTNTAVVEAKKATEGKADRGEIPTIYEWAKQPTKPTYTAQEVGAVSPNSVTNIVNDSVNANMNTYVDGETGIEYVGKYYGGNLYYVPTGNVYPPNN